MASIRDVAKHANVAACTVSRVLNGTSYVAPETRERIEKAMEELNYIPNELARSMFRQRVGIIAMLVPTIHHPFFASLSNHIEKELYQKGYKLMLCSTGDDSSIEKEYLETLKSNIVDGIIMGVNSLEAEEYKKLKKPVIMLDAYIEDNIPTIVSDHKKGGELAAQKFIDSGCQNIIHICGTQGDSVLSYQSHIALELMLKEHKIDVKPIAIEWHDFDFEKYYSFAKEVLTASPEIDGVMAADMVALAFLKAAMELGRNIPNDFCIIAYDGTYILNMNNVKVTSIVQPIKAIANEAIMMIEDLINEKEIISKFKVLPVELKSGETTK